MKPELTISYAGNICDCTRLPSSDLSSSERLLFLPCIANAGGIVKYFSIAGLLDLASWAGGCSFSAAGAGVFNDGLVGLE